jgi:hypothetical protein
VDVSEDFELVLEGLGDGSSETLRRIKGALLGDLGLTVSEAQTALSALPNTLRRAATSAELDTWHTILTHAGAQVLIVRPKTERTEIARLTAAASGGDTHVLESSLDFTLHPLTPPVTSAAQPYLSCAEIDFSLELSPPPQLPDLKEDLVPPNAKPAEVPVAELAVPSAPPLPDNSAVSASPGEGESASANTPLTLAESSAPAAPEAVVSLSVNSTAVAPPPALKSPPPDTAAKKKTTPSGSPAEGSGHAPLGRQHVVGMAAPTVPPKENVPSPTIHTTLGTEAHEPIVTPELIMAVSVGAIVLALVNWLLVLP